MGLLLDYTDYDTEAILQLAGSIKKRNMQKERMLQSMGATLEPVFGLTVRLNVMTTIILTGCSDMTDDIEKNRAIMEHMFQHELNNGLMQVEENVRKQMLMGAQVQGIIIPEGFQ